MGSHSITCHPAEVTFLLANIQFVDILLQSTVFKTFVKTGLLAVNPASPC